MSKYSKDLQIKFYTSKLLSILGSMVSVKGSDISDTKVACRVKGCKQKIELSDMRMHTGLHILKGDVAGPNVCGFCSRSTCQSTLVQSSKKNTQQFYRLETFCNYYYKMPTNYTFQEETHAQTAW